MSVAARRRSTRRPILLAGTLILTAAFPSQMLQPASATPAAGTAPGAPGTPSTPSTRDTQLVVTGGTTFTTGRTGTPPPRSGCWTAAA